MFLDYRFPLTWRATARSTRERPPSAASRTIDILNFALGFGRY
jgi:hypothetical protein